MSEFDRLREVVERAALLSGAERDEYLEHECGADAELLAEARELLDDRGDEDFLTPPLPGVASAAFGSAGTPEVHVGQTIGPYRCLRVLGSGGMGTVFEAEQDEPRRRVALKVLRGGSLGPRALERFHHEARLLARLRHPGIAQVYATGVHGEDGGGAALEIPWFAMQYVEGARNLLDHAREEELDLRDKLRLFLRICQAVQHGHTKGVVHRDLKPDNLLVDSGGNPVVIDFGVATATDSDGQLATRLTLAGQILGTVAYMSPEQFSDTDVDTRSDVFSLGVCLYELVSGQLPFDIAGKPLTRVAELVRDKPPRRLPDLPTDLEAILFKALEKQPERRYASASALAADIERLLDRKPVEARPPSTTYYLWTFARRHRALVAAGGAALAFLVVGGVVSLVLGIQARRAQAETRELFVALLDRSRETTSSMADELIALAGGVDIGRRLVTSAVEDLEDLSRRSDGDPEVRARLAEALYRRGSFEARAAGFASEPAQEALAHLDRAFAMAEELLERGGDPRVLRMLQAKCMLERSHVEIGIADAAAALASVARAEGLLEELRTSHPDDAEVVIELAYAFDARSVVLGKEGRLDEVEPALRRAQELFAEAERLNPSDRLHVLRRTGTQLVLAGLYLKTDRLLEAADEYGAVIDALEPKVRAEPESIALREQLGRALMHGGDARRQQGDAEGARRWLFEAIEHYRELVELDRFNVQNELSVANAAYALGLVEKSLEADPERARVWFAECLAVVETLEGDGRLPAAYAHFPAAARQQLDVLGAVDEKE